MPQPASADPLAFMPTIGSHVLRNNLFVAPMAGVTDRPFRQLCKRMGAGYAVSEMVASNAQLWKSEKTMRRANHAGEVEPISVQIAGADPQMLAEAARHNVANGAQIIDINMGCPAKKVCNVAAGSALLQNEPLVARIFTVDFPPLAAMRGLALTALEFLPPVKTALARQMMFGQRR